MSNKLSGVLMILVAAVGFSTKGIFVKLAYPYGIDGLSLVTLRMLMAFPFFAFIAWQSKPPAAVLAPNRKEWLAAVVLGVVGYYLASMLDFIGLQYISASMERLILFTYPTFVLLLSALWLRKKISIVQIGAVALTYLGMGLVFAGQGNAAPQPYFWWGVAYVLCSALTYAAYLVGSEQLVPRFGSALFTAIALMGAGLTTFLHYLCALPLAQLWAYPWQVYALSVGIAVGATVVPALLFSSGIKRLGADNASIAATLGPIATLLMAYSILGETINAVQGLGAVVIITGVLWMSRAGRKPSSVAEKPAPSESQNIASHTEVVLEK
ncbi:DMT family transporter [Eisenibacter elegans]|uniref:DMT family transporter n=1 Tax=Eisenibacter elegans TaxID=997 RepID=UPI0006864C64|nr:EamA family transporter [Eisenibacter elegans]